MSTRALPPFPPGGDDWRSWALQLVEFLRNRDESRAEVIPQSVLLEHQRTGTPARAAQEGVLMYDPVAGYPVVSKGGKWEQVVLGDNPVDFGIVIAEKEAFNLYGDTISVLAAGQTLLKFGKAFDIGATQETIWQQGGEEVLPTTNSIDTISSSDATDTQTTIMVGHTVIGTGLDAKFTQVIQTVTLNGQNKVVLPTPLARVQRAADTNTSVYGGDVYIYEDTAISSGVPTDGTKVHLKMLAGQTQSYKASFTVADDEYVIITGVVYSINKKTDARVDFEVLVQLPGRLFRPATPVTLSSVGTSAFTGQLYPYPVIPRNTDFKIAATSSTNNTDVSATIAGFYAKIIT